MAKQDSNLLRLGAPFQLIMIITFIFRRTSFYPQDNHLTVAGLTLIGLIIFTYCLYQLYTRKKAQHTLITSGPFKYTRHPMYTAFLLMDSGAWFAPWDLSLILSTTLFLTMLLAAAHFQEKETLARFGPEAEEYYKKTPRVFLLYPFRKYAVK